MKSFIQFCFFTLMVIILISCGSTVNKALWQSQPPAIANSSGLSNNYKFHDNGSDIYYTISNDLDNFYVSGKTNNLQTQKSILLSGIQFCIDTTGKYGDQTRIIFPFVIKQKENEGSKSNPITNGNTSSGRNQIVKQNSENLDVLKNKFRSEKKMMHLFGFKYPIAGAVPLPNDYGINMNITWDSSSTMLFQALVPFSTFYKKSLSVADSTKVFGLSMKLTGVQNPQSNNGMGGSGVGFGMGMGMGMGAMGMGMGMGGMGMGGMGMGGMGMGGVGMRIPIGGASPYGMSNSSYQQNSNIKKKIKLAVRPEK